MRCQSDNAVSTYGAEGGDAGVGKQAVDATEPLQGGTYRPFDIGFDRHITRHRPRVDALGT
jgi:hypothetical protein